MRAAPGVRLVPLAVVLAGGGFWLIGGMTDGQRVVDGVTGFALP